MNLDRMKRLLLLVPLARQHGHAGIPVEEALRALHFESVDELLEDVEQLMLVGDPSGTPEGFIDIYVEDGRVRVILPLAFKHPPRFTAVEGAAMLAALRPLENAGIEAVQAATSKLRDALPAQEDASLEAALLARAARIEASEPPQFRGLIDEAIARRRQIEVDYYALETGDRAMRVLEPRAILLHGGRWYLVAWKPEKGEQHLYRLDRMSGVRMTDRTFGDHKGPPLERYELDHLYIPSGQEQDVEVRFSALVADAVLRDWAEVAERNEDGTVTLRAHVSGGHYLMSWVLGYGGEAEIVGPPSARAQLAERVAQLRALYDPRPESP
jgi:predicted DNA-binding transcriptional regulator YafY